MYILSVKVVDILKGIWASGKKKINTAGVQGRGGEKKSNNRIPYPRGNRIYGPNRIHFLNKHNKYPQKTKVGYEENKEK